MESLKFFTLIQLMDSGEGHRLSSLSRWKLIIEKLRLNLNRQKAGRLHHALTPFMPYVCRASEQLSLSVSICKSLALTHFTPQCEPNSDYSYGIEVLIRTR